MAKVTRSLDDVMKALISANDAAQKAAEAKPETRKKNDYAGIGADLFKVDATLIQLEAEAKKLGKSVKVLRGEQNELARQRLAQLFSNIPSSELKDRSEEGVRALKSKMEEMRRAMYDAEHLESLPDSAKTKAGKAKYSTIDATRRTWRVGSQLIRDIETYGWSNVWKNGRVVSYAETLKWSIDDDGNIVKKRSQDGNENGGATTPPKDGYDLIEAAIVSLEQRFNRSDVDLSSQRGQELLTRAGAVIFTANMKAQSAKQ